MEWSRVEYSGSRVEWSGMELSRANRPSPRLTKMVGIVFHPQVKDTTRMFSLQHCSFQCWGASSLTFELYIVLDGLSCPGLTAPDPPQEARFQRRPEAAAPL